MSEPKLTLDAFDRRRLARAIRADQAHDLARTHVEVEIVDHNPTAIGLAQTMNSDYVLDLRCTRHAVIVRPTPPRHIHPRMEVLLYPSFRWSAR